MDKDIVKYNKKLTARQLIHNNYDTSVKDYKEKLAKCFEIRSRKMRQQTIRHKQNWDKIISKDKNYIMNKKGYKHMLTDINNAKYDLTKFKRGLSVFEEKNIKKTLTSDIAAPVLKDDELSFNFQ